MGTPLKDWDINIYRGVLTGCNEAFIISTEKRNEILANCKTEDERKRTEELIRPILRGRDIKRYGYEWADLWLINTHNGVKGRIPRIRIEDYPAVKAHLDQFWDKIKDRADQGDTPYNLRNCAYLEEFSKPKIIFQEIVQESQFTMDKYGQFICNDTGRIITGSNLYHILGIMNSSLFFFAIKRFYSGGNLGEHGVRMKHTFFEKFPCVKPCKEIEEASKGVLEQNTNKQADHIDRIVESLYQLSKPESDFIHKTLYQQDSLQ